MNKVWFALVTGSLLTFNLPADDEAKKIWDRASENIKNVTFTATTSTGAGKFKITQKMFQLKNPDGSVFRRLETSNPSGSTTLTITNLTGKYEINPGKKKILKIDYKPEKELPELSEYASYELKSGSYDNVDCYVVTRRIAENPQVLDKLEKWVAPIMKTTNKEELRKAVLRSFPAVNIYYIGKDNDFLYCREYYSFSGRFIGKVAYKNVKIGGKIDKSLFELPVGYSTEYAYTGAEFLKNSGELNKSDTQSAKRHPLAKKHGVPDTGTQVYNWGLRNLDAIGRFFLGAAIVLIIVLMAIKIKSRSAR